MSIISRFIAFFILLTAPLMGSSEKEECSYFLNLPRPIIQHIMSYLEPRDFGALRATNKKILESQSIDSYNQQQLGLYCPSHLQPFPYRYQEPQTLEIPSAIIAKSSLPTQLNELAEITLKCWQKVKDYHCIFGNWRDTKVLTTECFPSIDYENYSSCVSKINQSLYQVKTLRIAGNFENSIFDVIGNHFKNLTTLDLIFHPISLTPKQIECISPHATTLDVNFSPDGLITRMLKQLPYLTSFSLSMAQPLYRSAVSTAMEPIVAEIATASTLTRLELLLPLHRKGATQKLASLTQLLVLSLVEAGLEYNAFIPLSTSLTRLTALNLYGTRITDIDRIGEPSKEFHELAKKSLSNQDTKTEISDTVISVFSNLKNLTFLDVTCTTERERWLSNYAILKIIEALPKLTSFGFDTHVLVQKVKPNEDDLYDYEPYERDPAFLEIVRKKLAERQKP